MGYLHIENLYKNQTILMMKECYALEKIHGTSAHIRWSEGQIHFHPGGESNEKFKGLFDEAALAEKFKELNLPTVVLFGEAYGGKQQGMRETYGPNLKFVVFDVKINGYWLSVPNAEEIAKLLGLEFVSYERVSTDLKSLNAARDKESIQAIRNGMGPGKMREGVVLRPIVELTLNSGSRVIAKHKNDAFSERKSKKDTQLTEEQVQVLADAQTIADEWVTEMRLTHVLDKLEGPVGIERMPEVLKAMLEDVLREGAGEIEDSKAARKAITATTAKMFKERLKSSLK